MVSQLEYYYLKSTITVKLRFLLLPTSSNVLPKAQVYLRLLSFFLFWNAIPLLCRLYPFSISLLRLTALLKKEEEISRVFSRLEKRISSGGNRSTYTLHCLTCPRRRVHYCYPSVWRFSFLVPYTAPRVFITGYMPKGTFNSALRAFRRCSPRSRFLLNSAGKVRFLFRNSNRVILYIGRLLQTVQYDPPPPQVRPSLQCM